MLSYLSELASRRPQSWWAPVLVGPAATRHVRPSRPALPPRSNLPPRPACPHPAARQLVRPLATATSAATIGVAGTAPAAASAPAPAPAPAPDPFLANAALCALRAALALHSSRPPSPPALIFCAGTWRCWGGSRRVPLDLTRSSISAK